MGVSSRVKIIYLQNISDLILSYFRLEREAMRSIACFAYRASPAYIAVEAKVKTVHFISRKDAKAQP